MKQDFCAKCKKYGFVEKHHILPRNVFGENDQIEWLCPNCHTAYHQFLGTENLKNPDMVFSLINLSKMGGGIVACCFIFDLDFIFIKNMERTLKRQQRTIGAIVKIPLQNGFWTYARILEND